MPVCVLVRVFFPTRASGVLPGLYLTAYVFSPSQHATPVLGLCAPYFLSQSYFTLDLFYKFSFEELVPFFIWTKLSDECGYHPSKPWSMENLFA